MNENTSDSSPSSSNSKILLAVFWIASLLLVGFVGYGYGKAAVDSRSKTDEKVLSADSNQPATLHDPSTNADNVSATPVQTFTVPASSNTSSSSVTSTCNKTGFAQKWEYLTPYVIKQNDSLESIATDQLKDKSRVNELLQINGVGPLVIGSTLYLPPPSIPKSSGNIRQVYGKLVEENDTSWHISFTNDKSGQGLLIPSYLFTSVPNKDSFHIGDCVAVLFDDGYKIYSLSSQ